jgi:prepilin signal peptidase PulO-like enzyme (type II secretory pathway)
VNDAAAAVIAGLAGVPVAAIIDVLAVRLASEWVEDGDLDPAVADVLEHRAIGSGETPYLLAAGATLRRALVLAATVAVMASLGARYGWSWHLPVVAVYGAVLIACTVTDIIVHRIPNVFVYPAIIFAAIVGATVPGAGVRDVLLGGALVGGAFFAFALLPGGGFGDAKLGAFVGLALGLRFGGYAMLIGAMAGGAGAIAVVISRRFRDLRVPMAYGPYIALGAFVVMLVAGTAFVEL